MIMPGLGLGTPYKNAGAPSNGVDEVQTLTIGGTPTGGTFKLSFMGKTTSAITWSATDATLVANIDAALEALPTIGTGNVVTAAGTVSSGIGTVTITFGGRLAKLAVPTIAVADNSLTGTSPTLAIAETTAGVTATARGAAIGARLIDSTNGAVYINKGTANIPVWYRDIDGVGTVTAATASTTLTVAQSGGVFTNTGASGTITFSLPAATVGLNYKFYVGAAQELRIDPNGSETISLPSTGVAGAAGKYLMANAVGETVHLYCAKTGTWACFGYTGTWEAEG